MRLMQTLAASAALLALGGVALTSTLSAQPLLSRDCRSEVRRLCDSELDRDRIRTCLRERYAELSGDCQAELRNARGEASNRGFIRQAAGAQGAETVTFGEDERQAVDFYALPGGGARTPLILFIHGGGWTIGNRLLVQGKPAFAHANGFAFASTGYRLVPEATVEDQLADIDAAITALRGEAGALGFDPDRIVLMGHSAGAHLAALLATDPRYLGENFDAIAGVVLLDGAGYDVARQIVDARGVGASFYEAAFGKDPDRQAELSPVSHVAAPNAPKWLILYVADRVDSRKQSESLGSLLTRNGARAEVKPVRRTDHGRLNRELGDRDADQTKLVADWLKGV